MGGTWLLNLDCESELASPRGYRPRKAILEAFEPYLTFARELLGPEDRELPQLAEPSEFARAWCPTPNALSCLRAAGLEPGPAPDLEVLRAANDKSRQPVRPDGLPGTRCFDANSLDELEEDLMSRRGDFVLKRAWSVAGRGRRFVRADGWSEEDRAWARTSLETGGLRLEPRVEIEDEFCVHGSLGLDGSLRIGRPIRQRFDSNGNFVGTAPCSDASLAAELVGSARSAADWLRELRYFGPFGVDAYRYESGEGLRLQPASEINARYTLGYAEGMRDH